MSSQTLTLSDPATVVKALIELPHVAHQLISLAGIEDAAVLAECFVVPLMMSFYYNDYANPISCIQRKEFVFTTITDFKKLMVQYRSRVNNAIYIYIPETKLRFKFYYA